MPRSQRRTDSSTKRKTSTTKARQFGKRVEIKSAEAGAISERASIRALAGNRKGGD